MITWPNSHSTKAGLWIPLALFLDFLFGRREKANRIQSWHIVDLHSPRIFVSFLLSLLRVKRCWAHTIQSQLWTFQPYLDSLGDPGATVFLLQLLSTDQAASSSGSVQGRSLWGWCFLNNLREIDLIYLLGYDMVVIQNDGPKTHSLISLSNVSHFQVDWGAIILWPVTYIDWPIWWNFA